MRGRPGLNRRAGDLSKSFDSMDVSTGTGLSGIAAMGFTTSRYARIHEKGGVIEAKGTVTIHRKAHRAERFRYTKKGRKKRGSRTTYDVAGTTYVRRKLLCWKDEKGVWHFAKKVTIPARLEWFASFARDEGGRNAMLRLMCEHALGRKGTLPGRGPQQQGPAAPPEGG
jgi:hypothetical protein